MDLASTEWFGLPVEVQRAGRPPSEPIRSEVSFLGDWCAWASGVGARTLATMPGNWGRPAVAVFPRSKFGEGIMPAAPWCHLEG